MDKPNKFKQFYEILNKSNDFSGLYENEDQLRSVLNDDTKSEKFFSILNQSEDFSGVFSDKNQMFEAIEFKKKSPTWSQDFGKAYESMPQGSPSGTKSPTTPSASTSLKKESSVADIAKRVIPVIGIASDKNEASAPELKAEERFANYTKAIQNINGRIEKSTVAADQLVKQYEALGAEMTQLNQIISSKLTPQAEKTKAALRGKQIEAQGEQIKSQIEGLKSNYEVDVNRKNFLFKAAIDQKAIIDNKINDDFSFAKHFGRTTFGSIIKSAGSAINGIGDLAELTHKVQWGLSDKVSSDKLTDKIGTELATIGSDIYNEAQARVPEAAQWNPEMGLKELTPFRTAVFATNAVASTTPSILAALSGSKTATITTSAIMNFGDAYDVAKQRGFSDEKAALVAAAITVPVTMLDQLGLDQILKANKNAFSQFVKSETLKRLAGKELSKDVIFAVSKEVFTEGLKRFGKTAGKIVLTEVPTEAAQGAIQEAGIQLADKQKLDYAKLGYATEAEALGGFFGAGAMSLGASYKAMRFNPTAYGVAMGTKNAEFAADLQEMIAQEVKTGNLTEEQAQEVTQNIKTIVETDAIIPSTVTNPDARIDAINLVGEKNALMQEMEGMEPAMVLDKKERINQIEAELTNISLTNLPTNAQTTNTEATTGAGQTNNGSSGTGSTSRATTATDAGQAQGVNAEDIRSQAEQQREQVRKDMEIEAFQERTGFPLYDPFEQMPDMVQVTLGRVADGDTVDPVQVKEASDWLYTEYKRLDAMKVADNRTMTIPQIEEIQAEIEGEITLLENEYNQVEQQNQERAAVGEGNQQTEGVTATEAGTEVNGASTETNEAGEAATTEGQEATVTQEEGTGTAQETAGTEDKNKLDDNVIAEAEKRGITAPHALRILDKYTPNWRTNPNQAKAFDAAMRVRAAQKGDKAQAGKWSLLSKNPKLFLATRMINRTFGMLGVKTLILNDSDFNAIHESISGQTGSGKLRNATFDPMTKTIYLKSSNLAQTAFHEIAHPFLESLRLSDQAAYDAIVERVKSLDAVKPDTRGKSYFQWAQDLYAGKDQSVIDNEAVAEFLADTLSGGVGVSDMLKAEAMQVVNDILKRFGYKGTVNKPVTLKFIAENIPNFETIVTQAVANSMILEGEVAEAEGQEMRDQETTEDEVQDQMIPRETLENNQVATALEQEAIIAAADYMQNSINMDAKAAEYAAKSDDVIESDISKPVSITDENSEVVFAFMEAIRRAEAAPDRKFRGKTIPEILIPLSKIATFSGKVMRFMRMLPKFSTKAQSEAMFALIENNGYKLSPAQKTMLSEKIGAARLAVQAVETAKTAYLNTGTEAARKLMEAERRKQEKVDRDLADTLLPMLPADYLDRFISNMQGDIQAVPSLIANLTSGMEAYPRTLIETAARGFFDITVGAAIGRPKSAASAIIAGFNPFWRGVRNIPSESIKTLLYGSDIHIDGNARQYSARISPKAIYNALTNPNMKMRVPGAKSFEVFQTKDEIQVREVLSDVKGKLLGAYSDERVAAVEASKVPGSKAFGNEVYQMIETQRGPVVSSYQKPVVPNQALLDALLGQAEDEAYVLSTKPDPGHQFYFVTSQIAGLTAEALNRVSTLTDNAVRNPLQMARLTEEARRHDMSVDRLVAYAALDETGEFSKYLEYLAKSQTYQQENRIATSISKAEARIKNWIKTRDNNAVKVGTAVIFILAKSQLLFTKTPLNVLNRMVDVIMSGYPSFAQATYYFGESYAASKKGDRVKTDLNYSKGVNYFAKGMSAWAFNMAAAFILSIPGAVIAGYDSLDDKRKAALEAQRVPPGSMNVSAVERATNGGSPEWQKGDKILPLRYFGQLGQAILFRANIQTRADVKAEKDASSGNAQIIQDKWLSDQMDAWLTEQLNVISAVPKQAFEFSSMAGVNTLINTINADKGKKWSEWSRGMTQSILAGFGVPATYSKAMEEELKQELVDPNSMKNTVMNVGMYRLGVSNPELFARVDALGFPVRNTAEGNNPLKRADYAPNELWQKLIKLKEETKKPGVIPSSFRVGTEKVTDMLDIETYELLAKDTDTLNRMRGAYRVTELEKLFNDKTYELTNGKVGSVFDEPDLEVKARMVINAINEADNMFKPEYKKYLVELSRKAGYPKLDQLEQMLIDDNEQK